MPRKIRPGKSRRFSFAFEKLSIRDVLFLSMDEPLKLPINTGEMDCLRTLDDFAQAWSENRSYFMDGGFNDHEKPSPYDSYMRFHPGKRPWAFWLFDRCYPTVPTNQILELQRLRELFPGEFEAAQRFAKDFQRNYNEDELKTLFPE